MKKSLIVLCVLVLFLAAVAYAGDVVIKVKVQTANVRMKPDITSAVISRVSQGAMFEATKKVGNFYEIQVTDSSGNLVTGYISADVVEEVGAAQPVAPARPQATRPARPEPSGGAPKAGGIFVELGPVFSNLTFDSETQASIDESESKKKMKLGFRLGVGYEYPLGQNLSVIPGLYFSTAGSKFDYTFQAKAASDAYSFSTIILPIDVKYSFNGPFAMVGPYIGYMLSAKYVVDAAVAKALNMDPDYIYLFKPDEEGNVYMNRLHFGISLGAGYEMNMGGKILTIKLGYQLGLSKLNKPIDDTDKSSMKHNAITFLLGLKI